MTGSQGEKWTQEIVWLNPQVVSSAQVYLIQDEEII